MEAESVWQGLLLRTPSNPLKPPRHAATHGCGAEAMDAGRDGLSNTAIASSAFLTES